MLTASIRWVGDVSLVKLHKTAFLCSQNTPHSIAPVITRWINDFKAEGCLVCGNESEMEQMVFAIALRRRVPTILLLSEAFPAHFPSHIQSAINSGLLLVGTHCNDDVHFSNRQSAVDRNRVIIDLSDDVVVGYSSENGDVARSTQNLSNVSYLTHIGHSFASRTTASNELYQRNYHKRRFISSRVASFLLTLVVCIIVFAVVLGILYAIFGAALSFVIYVLMAIVGLYLLICFFFRL